MSQPTDSQAESRPDPVTRATPTWVKVGLAVLALLGVLLVASALAGGHGPGMHGALGG